MNPAGDDRAAEPAYRRDPGLQPERTRLAWRRTTLTFTVVAVLAGRQAMADGTSTAGAVALCLSALVWAAFLAVTHGRVRTLGDGARPPVLSQRRATAAAVCTAALAGFAVLTVLC